MASPAENYSTIATHELLLISEYSRELRDVQIFRLKRAGAQVDGVGAKKTASYGWETLDT